MDRRDYLRALGGAGVTGIVGSIASTSATAQSTFDEAAADQRIRENQTGPLTVEVVDESGAPVSGASVDVEMQEHDFVWGAEVAADLLVNQYSEGDPYIDHFLDLFNTAVLENIHKWAIWEGNRSLADAAVDWLDQRGYRIRGHTCIYSVDYAIPGRVQTAMNNGDGQTVREETMRHLREIITHYGDTIMEWDVVNEVVHEPELVEAIEGSNVTAHQSSTLTDWYAEAESVIAQNGLDVEIVTNDYNTLTWDPDPYYDQVQHLVNQGVGLDALCHQAHVGPSPPSGQEWSYASIDEMFEFYADLGPRQRITEFDMTGDSWTGQEQRARVLERFLKTAYGHPDFDEFTFWGFWDGAHWRDEAPFFEEDWSEKPALNVYRNLVFDEWWTSESGTTDSQGSFAVDAFLGEHEVTVSTSEGSVTQTVSVTDPNAGQQLTVTVDGGEVSPADSPAVNAGGEAHQTADGVTYVADEGFSAGATHSTADPITGTDEDALYQTERYGEAFAYEFGLEAGTYDVRVHFAEIFHEADGERVFDVLVDGTTAIADLDIHAEVGHDTALTRTIEDVAVADGTLTVSFQASADNAKVSAITVVPTSDEPGGIDLGEYTARDPNGDGHYTDVNGNGSNDFQDVVAFFEEMNSSGVQNNVSAFDFNENGSIDFQDVVALFEVI